MKKNFSLPTPLVDFFIETRGRLENEFESNERLKWLVAASGLVVYISLVLYLAGQADQAENKYISTQTRLAQLKTQISDNDWSTKATEAVAHNNALRERFWPGDTPGLAEAGFERWIRQTMSKHGIEVRQVQLTRSQVLDAQLDFETSDLASVQRIRAKVIGPLDEAAVIRFLNDAAFHESWVIIDQLVARGGRSDRFEMDITTLFNLEQEVR